MRFIKNKKRRHLRQKRLCRAVGNQTDPKSADYGCCGYIHMNVAAAKAALNDMKEQLDLFRRQTQFRVGQIRKCSQAELLAFKDKVNVGPFHSALGCVLKR